MKHEVGTDLSVILSTWNRATMLGTTLHAISQCAVPARLEWELVIVNNNCTDDTDEVVKSFTRILPIRYVKEPRQGLSRAKNAGLAAASGRLVVFTDDDVQPSQEWIASYWASYQQRLSGYYFGGPVECEYETPGLPRELLDVAPAEVRGIDYGSRERVLSKNKYFIAPNWACPIGPLRELGGFDVEKGLDPSLGKLRVGEETDLMERLQMAGLSPWYVPQAGIKHFVPSRKSTLKHIAARGEADGFYAASKSVGSWSGPTILSVPRWMYREALTHALQYAYAKAIRKNGYREYVSFRQTLGAMKAFRGPLKTRRSNTLDGHGLRWTEKA